MGIVDCWWTWILGNHLCTIQCLSILIDRYQIRMPPEIQRFARFSFLRLVSVHAGRSFIFYIIRNDLVDLQITLQTFAYNSLYCSNDRFSNTYMHFNISLILETEMHNRHCIQSRKITVYFLLLPASSHSNSNIWSFPWTETKRATEMQCENEAKNKTKKKTIFRIVFTFNRPDSHKQNSN